MLTAQLRIKQITTSAAVILGLVAGWLSVEFAVAEERGIFDYEFQRKAKDGITKIVFIGDAGAHGPPGNHEFVAGFMLLARQLHEAFPQVHCVVYPSNHWPGDLSHADAVIVGLNHGHQAAVDPEIFAAIRRGAGFMAVHYGVEVDKGNEGNNYLQWIGGYFETFWSVNPWWTPKYEKFPDHPVARGITPFSVHDEWYYHMRFVGNMKGLTPILTDVPPLETVNETASSRKGNPDVFRNVSEQIPQHMAWAYDRPDGGRGFGFTGLHLHANLANDNFRTVLLNAVAWTAGLEIPQDGIPSETVREPELKRLIIEAKAVRESKSPQTLHP